MIAASSSLFFFNKWATVTEHPPPPSTSHPPPHTPHSPPHRGTNWIVNSSAEDGGAAAAALLNLQRETVRLQTEHLYLDALLSPCTSSVPPFVPSLHIPPSPRSSCSDVILAAAASRGDAPDPNGRRRQLHRAQPTELRASGSVQSRPVTGVMLST